MQTLKLRSTQNEYHISLVSCYCGQYSHTTESCQVRPSNAPALRILLRQYPDGLSIAELEAATGYLNGSITTALHSMPDAYIDRWLTRGVQGPPRAVWCIVYVPEDCPRPTVKKATK